MKKYLQVTVISVKNLPKMDLLGTCDPFCRLIFCGEQVQTSVKKNTYSADFNETFEFDLSNDQNPSALSIEVLDWDRLGAADVVGKVILLDSVMSKIIQTGVRQEFEYKVMSADGKIVIWQNKAETVVKVAFQFVDTTPPPSSPSKSSPEAQSTRILEIKVVEIHSS